MIYLPSLPLPKAQCSIFRCNDRPYPFMPSFLKSTVRDVVSLIFVHDVLGLVS